MNKCFKIILTAILVLIAGISYSFAATGTITGTGVRVRKEPNTNAEIIINLYKDNKVEVLEKDGNWYKIKYEDKEGYTHKDYINVSEDVAQVPQEDTTNNKENKENNENIIVNSKIKMKSNAKIYILPLIYSTVTNNIEEGKEVTVMKKVSDWSCINTDGITGWVRNCYLLGKVEQPKPEELPITEQPVVEEPTTVEQPEQKPEEPQNTATQETVIKKGYINEISGVNIRENADKGSKILATVGMNAEVSIYSEEGEWYKVSVNGVNGYVYKPLVSDNKTETTNRSQQTPREEQIAESVEQKQNVLEPQVQISNETKGAEIVNFAKKFLGYKYVYGGTTPSGFDCSGFVYYVFNQLGIGLSRSLSVQNTSGVYVEKGNLQLGDIIIFNDWDNISIGHVGIYIGDNQFIHAANSSRGVVTDYMDTRNSYYNIRYVTARRLV